MSYLPTLKDKIHYKTTNTDTLWRNPSLSSNGTLGGGSFAVAASSVYRVDWSPFYSFQESPSGDVCWTSNTVASTLTLYNPTPVKAYRFHGDLNWASGQLYGSNDNTNWTQIQTFTYSVAGVKDIDISTSEYYKYYKFNIVTTVANAKARLGQLASLMGYTQSSNTVVVDSPDYTSSVDVNSGYEIITSSGKVYQIEKGV